MRFQLSAAIILTAFLFATDCRAYNCIESQRTLANTGTCNKDSELLCRDMCSGDTIVTRKNCSTQSHCCYRRGKCFLKAPVVSQEPSGINLEALAASFMSELKPKGEPSSTDARFLSIGGNTNNGNNFNLNGGFPNTAGPLFPTGNFPFTGGLTGTGPITGLGGFGQQCLTFPNNCQVQFTSVNDMQPPVNIPYCQRIECPTSGLSAHTEISQCLSTPGCAFDYELYRFRSVLGQAILPGVPVCHLAIRNEAFLAKANQYTQKSGQPWNPLLTNCLIEEYSNEILGGSPGCYMVDVLLHFNNFAKRAGWQGITEYECYLIDGCWRPSIGCLYPVGLNQITVRSGNNDKPAQPTERDLFGQPLCLPFDSTLTNGDFLNSYHSCLAAGCAANVNTNTLLQQLYGVATGYFSSYQLQQQFWNMVLSGQVRADNWKRVADKIIADDKRNNPLGNNPLNNLFGNFNNPMSSTSNPNTLQNLLNFYSSNLRPVTQTPVNNQTPDILAYSLNLNNTQGRQFNLLSSGNFQPSTGSSGNPINSLLGLNSLIGSNGFSSIYKPPCPYKNVDWPGIPPLTGSFVGCCEQPLCYTPRSGLRRQYSGVSSYITEWTPWGACSKTCGSGYQYRERRCVGKECGEAEQETQTCNSQICPFWREWSSFQPCDKPCGGGQRSRTRSCSASFGCEGKSIEHESCNTGKCATFTNWGLWSECGTKCGTGKKTRHRTCTDGGEYGCRASLTQEKDCVVYCGRIKYSESSSCDIETCTSTKTVSCENDDGSEGYCRPDQMKPKVSRCYEGICFCRYFPNNYPCNVNLFNG